MKHRSSAVCAAVVVALSIVSAVASSATPPYPRAAAVSVDWPSYNNDVASDRFVNVAQINTTNAAQLHVICSAALGTPDNLQTGPIVVDGVLYATRANQTFALDATTCASKWTTTYPSTSLTQTSRGLAYANGRLYRGFADGHVVAIDASSGKIVWNTLAIAPGSSEKIAAAPIVWKGAVIVGTRNIEEAQVCHLLAIAATTGKLLWSEPTVPAPGGPYAGTWKGATGIAGGSMWTSFTLDPATGLLYVPIGNPEADFDVRQRGGTNLATDSVLEVDPANGSIARMIQLVPGDYHDWDIAAAPSVVTLASGSKVMLIAGKDGYLRSVALATFTQNWQTAVTTIANAAAPITTAGTHYCPWGGVLWNGAAYSPQTGLAYVNAIDWCTTVQLAATPQPYVPGELWTGSANGFGVRDAAKSGWLNAIDATTGGVRWRFHSTTPLVAGVTPTAGGLVITGDLAGNVLVFNATTGALLATVPTNKALGGGIISYEVKGKQYIAVAAGMASSNFATPNVAPSLIVIGR